MLMHHGFLGTDKSREVNFCCTVFDEVECIVSWVLLVSVCLILSTSNCQLCIKMLCHLYPVYYIVLTECSDVADR